MALMNSIFATLFLVTVYLWIVDFITRGIRERRVLILILYHTRKVIENSIDEVLTKRIITNLLHNAIVLHTS